MSWEAIAAISSAVIAFCALILTVWQAIVARRHNKLSVTPHLNTWSHSDNVNKQYSIELLNNGIGPALVESFQIQVDGCPVPGEGVEVIESVIKILFPFPQYQYTSYHSYVSKGYMMGAKESRNLLTIQFRGENLPSPEEVKGVFRRTRLLIEYNSIYGEKFVLNMPNFQD